jgi:hypothetical protein
VSKSVVDLFVEKADTDASALYAKSERLKGLAKIMSEEGLNVSADQLERLGEGYARVAHDLRMLANSMSVTPSREPT